MNTAVKLDHIGVAIKDLERGRAAYARLGFNLTLRSIHRGSPTPGAPVIPFGSGNHCAMFLEGYLEIVGLTDPAIFSNIKPLVARYEGAHIVAFGVESADATYKELSGRGIPIEAARQLERDAAYGPQGTELRRAAFRNMYFDRAVYPEARLLYIEHLTRDVLWQPHLLDHPNGVVALRDIFLCVTDAGTVADKYAKLFGVKAEAASAGEWRIKLAHGHVWIATPEAWARRAPGAAVPALPSPAGIGFKVKNIAATRALLAKNGVEARDGLDGGIWVAPEHACGAAIYFFGN
ncbi:MAG: VOC family protein [Betaproteobacteria bacterium]|nr:VOC family protein [Betaproteobacteria bacterium]